MTAAMSTSCPAATRSSDRNARPPIPPERFLHHDGQDRVVVAVPAPVAADLVALVRERHRQLRGLDPLRDAVLAALIIGAEVWRQQVGTNAAPTPEPAPRSPVMTATRAADVLGISDRAVRKACAAGRLDAELVDGQWRITRASVEAYEPRRSIR
ncbi:helix-turn-helix domain-containing protein [Modestobacter marinus]|uniref:helix-turn-helix domain-containing protein n=1 Tax=Modestobacter marinus TaxID=477641 RepID=UPI001C984646|nr:helix-turn-helix domain-containing protein [Modestobacter marinus]